MRRPNAGASVEDLAAELNNVGQMTVKEKKRDAGKSTGKRAGGRMALGTRRAETATSLAELRELAVKSLPMPTAEAFTSIEAADAWTESRIAALGPLAVITMQDALLSMDPAQAVRKWSAAKEILSAIASRKNRESGNMLPRSPITVLVGGDVNIPPWASDKAKERVVEAVPPPVLPPQSEVVHDDTLVGAGAGPDEQPVVQAKQGRPPKYRSPVFLPTAESDG